MASIKQMKSGRWQAQVARRGIRKSKMFDTRRAAQTWATREEYLIAQGSTAPQSKLTLSEVLKRYASEVSPTKRGERWEVLRIRAMCRDPLASKLITEITSADVAGWRDRRLRKVSGGTVNRELNLLSSVFTKARRDWGLIDRSPTTDVMRPSPAKPRDRLVTAREIEMLHVAAGGDLATETRRAFQAFLFACETAMRAGEIVGLTWDNLDLKSRVAHLPITKNGTARDVPLSSAAVALIEAMPRNDPVFGLTPKRLDVLWRKVRDRSGVEGLTFHDSRHKAITDLSKKVEVLQLARIVGHKNVSQLLTYYNESAADIAKKLD